MADNKEEELISENKKEELISENKKEILKAFNSLAGRDWLYNLVDWLIESSSSAGTVKDADGLEKIIEGGSQLTWMTFYTAWSVTKNIFQGTLNTLVATKDFVLYPISSTKTILDVMSNVATVLKCVVSKDYGRIINDKEFQAELLKQENVKNFFEKFSTPEKGEKLEKAAAYWMNLPQNDKNDFLDREVLGHVIKLLESKEVRDEVFAKGPTLVTLYYQGANLQKGLEKFYTTANFGGLAERKESCKNWLKFSAEKLALAAKGSLTILEKGRLEKLEQAVTKLEQNLKSDLQVVEVVAVQTELERVNQEIIAKAKEIEAKPEVIAKRKEIEENRQESEKILLELLPVLYASGAQEIIEAKIGVLSQSGVSEYLNFKTIAPLLDAVAKGGGEEAAVDAREQVGKLLAAFRKPAVEMTKDLLSVLESDVGDVAKDVLKIMIAEGSLLPFLFEEQPLDDASKKEWMKRYNLSSLGQQLVKYGLLPLKENATTYEFYAQGEFVKDKNGNVILTLKQFKVRLEKTIDTSRLIKLTEKETLNSILNSTKNLFSALAQKDAMRMSEEMVKALTDKDMSEAVKDSIGTIIKKGSALPFLFEVDIANSKDGKIYYKLSGIGQNLANFGLLPLKNGVAVDKKDVDTLNTQIAAIEKNIADKDTSEEDKQEYKKVLATQQQIKSVLYQQYELTVQGKMTVSEKGVVSVKVGDETFKGAVDTKFDLTGTLDIVGALLKDRDTMLRVEEFFREFNSGGVVSPTQWSAMAAQIVTKNPDLIKFVIKNRALLADVAKRATPEQILKDYGLASDFLDIINGLSGSDLEKVEKILTQLAAGNTADVTKELIDLLSTSEKLLGEKYLRSGKFIKHIGNLVVALGGENGKLGMMKDYLAQPEFKPLRETMNNSLQTVFPNLVDLLQTDAGKEILKEVNGVMARGKVVNGFISLPEVVGKKLPDTVPADLYKLLLSTKNPGMLFYENADRTIKLSAENTAEIQRVMTACKYDTPKDFRAALAKGEMASLGIELYNQTTALFKTETPKNLDGSDKVLTESQTKLVEQLEAERKVVFDIIKAAQNIQKFNAAIANAEENGTLSRTTATSVRKMYDEFQERNANIMSGYDGTSPLENPFGELCVVVTREENLAKFMEAGKGLNVAQIDFVLKQVKGSTLETGVVIISDFENALKKCTTISEETRRALVNTFSYNLIDLQTLRARTKGAEDIGSLQDMLTGIFVPFSALSTNDTERDNTLSLLNKILPLIGSNTDAANAVKNIIKTKGADNKDYAKLGAVLIEEIFINNEEKYTAEEKATLIKLIKGIVAQQNLPVSVGGLGFNVNTLGAIHKMFDVKYLQNPNFAKKVVEAARSYANDKGVKGAVQGLGGWMSALGTVTSTWWSATQPVMPNFGVFVDEIGKQRAKNNLVDVRSIGRSALFMEHGLFAFAGQKLFIERDDGVYNEEMVKVHMNLSSCNFTDMKFDGATICANFENSKFTNASFGGCKFEGEQTSFKNATLDITSFESLAAAAKAQKIDVSKLLDGAKVYSKEFGEVNAVLLYQAMESGKTKTAKDVIAEVSTLEKHLNFSKILEIATAVVEAKVGRKNTTKNDLFECVKALSELEKTELESLITMFNNPEQKDYIIGKLPFPGIATVGYDSKTYASIVSSAHNVINNGTELSAIGKLSAKIATLYGKGTDNAMQERLSGLGIAAFNGFDKNTVKFIQELNKADGDDLLASLIFYKLKELEMGKPSLTLDKNPKECSEGVGCYIKGLQKKMAENSITAVGQYVNQCKTNATTIADKVCKYHGTTDEKSKANLAAQLTVGLFNLGKTLDESGIAKIAGVTTTNSAVGEYTLKINPPVGIANIVKCYGGYLIGWYEIPPYDKNTATIISGVEKSLEGKEEIYNLTIS